MNLNIKPIVVDSLNLLLNQAGPVPLMHIERISGGIVGGPGQMEDIELYYRDGTIERFSILEMDKSEMFMAIIEAIIKHQ